MADQAYEHEVKFTKIAIIFSFISLGLGGLFGILQLLERTPGMPQLLDRQQYYTALTGHGVLLAIVWTAFFIMAIAVHVVSRELQVRLSRTLLNLTLILTIGGTLVAAVPILTGDAAVLYTFYAPLKAHVAFYLGAGVLILGTWVFAVAIFKAFIEWKKKYPDKALPIATMGVLTTLIIWLEATPPLVYMVLKDLVPMALVNKPVDVLETRTYFWYFGHPLVYFWIVPAVTLWYFAIPKLLGVEIFSRQMAKVAFLLFILASTPVGLHHQFLDPGVSDAAKLLHTILTFTVASPSFLTAFNVLATLEKGGRKAGGKGALGWLSKLPWGNPVFAGLTLAFIMFGFGGISGVINASYTLNYIVHNTLWVVGHFHLTVGTAATLSFMAASYLMVPRLFGKQIYSERMALAQPYLWFIGMAIFSLAFHIVGLLGVPRRTYDVTYAGLAPPEWLPWLIMGAIGGIVFWFSGVIFLANMGLTLISGRRITEPQPCLFTLDFSKLPSATRLDSIKFWVGLAIVVILIAYFVPFLEIYGRGLSPAPPVTPQGLRLG